MLFCILYCFKLSLIMRVIILGIDADVNNSLKPLTHHDIIADFGDDSRSLGMCVTLQ